MSLCPSCGRVYCDHTAKQRGQTEAEMLRALNPEEEKVWANEPADSKEKIRVAKKNAHIRPA